MAYAKADEDEGGDGEGLGNAPPLVDELLGIEEDEDEGDEDEAVMVEADDAL